MSNTCLTCSGIFASYFPSIKQFNPFSRWLTLSICRQNIFSHPFHSFHLFVSTDLSRNSSNSTRGTDKHANFINGTFSSHTDKNNQSNQPPPAHYTTIPITPPLILQYLRSQEKRRKQEISSSDLFVGIIYLFLRLIFNGIQLQNS